MCAQCVAGSVPYVVVGIGGLQAIRWRAKHRRAASAENVSAAGATTGRAPSASPARDR